MKGYLGVFVICWPLQAWASPEDLCDRAAAQASAESGVPLALLRAITRIETGRNGTPWPWTLNVNGEGHWFETADAAVDAVEAAEGDGAAQVDVGCFQMNLRWHGARFANAAAMIDPLSNARQAAAFLSELKAETGDWRMAAAAYHSRTPELGDAYVARLEAAHAADEVLETQDPPAPENRFPLLVAGETGSIGSIVPYGRGLSPLIGAP